ncbi:MAG: R3H domain-containing nucleic acid-binding protein [Patescibacteria group bacterium]
MKKQSKIIESFIKEILRKLTIDGEIEVLEDEDTFQFIIKTKEAGILIGENGQHLTALSHIVKKIIDQEFKKENLEKISFFLDVNDYQTKRTEELKNIARMTAQRVRYFKKEIPLDPMNAYERKIIHSALTEYPDITTESFGEEPNRRIMIKPYL